MAELLLAKGAEVSAKNNKGLTALHMAATQGVGGFVSTWEGPRDYKGIAQLLLVHGAEINEGSKLRTTALHVAVFREHREMVKWLLSKGADVHARTRDGATPMDLAVAEGYELIIELLRQYGGVPGGTQPRST